jgi:lysophospholipid acyltransferase (LPLAT)-like uncharacterized protein
LAAPEPRRGDRAKLKPSRPRRAEGRGVRLARWLLAPLAAWLLRAFARTWRLDVRGPNPLAGVEAPTLLRATWHRNILVGAAIFRDSGMRVAVSSSRDGEHITAVLTHLGLGRPLRGSSSRGGVTALRGMVRVARHGGLVGIFPDGPKGPARRVKPGVIGVARLSGRAVLPVGISARPCLRFSSWDRTLLPLPFARVVCQVGDAVAVERNAGPERREAARRELEARLEQLTRAVDAELAQRNP